jgi:3D (Asp-Asp-Asp) domain-containing protein
MDILKHLVKYALTFAFIIFVLISASRTEHKLIDIIAQQDGEIKTLNAQVSGLVERVFADKPEPLPPVYNINVYAQAAPDETDEAEPEPPKEYIPLGKLRITGYCGCSICCGNNANNRPDGIVRGASGNELIPGLSAASSAALPFGTVVDVEGYGERVIHDRIAKWVTDKHGESIDIYFATHAEALEMNLKALEVRIVKVEGE